MNEGYALTTLLRTRQKPDQKSKPIATVVVSYNTASHPIFESQSQRATIKMHSASKYQPVNQ